LAAILLYVIPANSNLHVSTRREITRGPADAIFPGPPAWYRKCFHYSMPTHPPIHQVFQFPRCLTNYSVLTRRSRCLEFSAGTLTSTPHRGVCLPTAPRSRVTSTSGCTTALSPTGQDRPLFRLAWVKAQISEIHAISLLHTPHVVPSAVLLACITCTTRLLVNSDLLKWDSLQRPLPEHALAASATCLMLSNLSMQIEFPLEQGRIEPRRTVAAMGSKVDASSGQPLEGPCGRTNDVGLVTHL
jgi:hypothetical protein